MTTPEDLRVAFDLASVEPASLSPWASVHRAVTRDGAPVVVKRTPGDQRRAAAMARWTRALAAAGLPVVSPVPLPGPNPRGLAAPGEDEPGWWVVYPFVEGRAYDASPADVEAAGDLLGQVHAAPLTPGLARDLRAHAWPGTTRAEVDDDLRTLDRVLRDHTGDAAPEAIGCVEALAERWWETALPGLRAADAAEPLPRAGVSSDFKAANLVYADGRPVLVDPDNGGVEPRLLDLALALVLFHHESPSAPGRLLTPSEWDRFARAYLRHVGLTARERRLWPLALDHVLWEEGSWALEDQDADAWADPRQGSQLLDLALVVPDDYPLP